jgi:hypothetical protein
MDYTFSRLYGNYGGLASSDENGRTDPNINRYFDNLVMSYDDRQQQVFGNLATDRPHVIKLTGTYDLPWGSSLGVYGILESGLPQTGEFSWQGYPIYYGGRGNLGRLPAFKQVDLQAQHEFRVGGNRRLSVQANIVNLFDTKTITYWYGVNPYRDGVFPSDAEFFGGAWTPEQVVAKYRALGSTIRDQVWFKTPNTYQNRREIRLQAKFSF